MPNSVSVRARWGDPWHRELPHTGSVTLLADHLRSTKNGSFWLPRPPTDPVRGYELRGRDGFVADEYVRIMFSQSFNVGDFCGCWFAPLIAGRPAVVLPGSNALAVVGSILHWGIRYQWGSAARARSACAH